MKKLVEVFEVDSKTEGLDALIGEKVLLICSAYFYTGKLVGVNDTFVKLDDPAIVYETGAWTNKAYVDVQPLHVKTWCVQRAAIESFGVSK
jgi:hypothetical protein